MDREQIAKQLIEAGARLYERGLLVATDGNLSARAAPGQILITASGVCKGALRREDLTLVTDRGEVLEGRKPARDIRMHLAIYEVRPEMRAVVHAHPPAATGLAMTETDLTRIALPEVLFSLGGVAATDYAAPTTIATARAVRAALLRDGECRALLLANHGALTMGEDVMQAFYRMETLELFAKTTAISRLLGGVRYLAREEEELARKLMRGADPDELVPPTEEERQ